MPSVPALCAAAALVVLLPSTSVAASDDPVAEVDDARGDWQQPALSAADTPAAGDGRRGPDLVNAYAAYVPKIVDVVLTVDDRSIVDFASIAIGAGSSDLRGRDGHYVATVQVYDGGRRFGPVTVVQLLPNAERRVSCKGAVLTPQGDGTIAISVPTKCLGLSGPKGKPAKRLAVLPRVGRYTAADRRSVWQYDTLDKPMIVRRDKPTDPCAASGAFGC